MNGPQHAPPPPVMLTPEAVAERLQIAPGTLGNWRRIGRGPGWAKLGRKVMYPLETVLAFEQELLRQAGVPAAAPAPQAARR